YSPRATQRRGARTRVTEVAYALEKSSELSFILFSQRFESNRLYRRTKRKLRSGKRYGECSDGIKTSFDSLSFFHFNQRGGTPLKKYFQFDELGTNYKTEFTAGLTTFIAMA